MKTRWIIVGAAAFFFAVAGSYAQEAAKPPIPKPPQAPALESIFKAADADHDGKLTFDEFKTAAPKVVKALRPASPPPPAQADLRKKLLAADADKDGKISAQEFKTAFPKAPAERFANMDKNNDGMLCPAEMTPPPHAAKPAAPQRPAPKGHGPKGPHFDAAAIKAADKDNDGKVTFDEARAARPNLPEEAFKKMDVDKDGALTGKDAQAARERAQKERQAKMRAADTNGDQKVSLEEAQKAFPDMTPEQFKKRDANADGFLSKDDQPVKKNK